jgi:hypothetical protein
MKLLTIRLGCQRTSAKSLVIPPAGEGIYKAISTQCNELPEYFHISLNRAPINKLKPDRLSACAIIPAQDCREAGLLVVCREVKLKLAVSGIKKRDFSEVRAHGKQDVVHIAGLPENTGAPGTP